jgi:hypothetical protein
VSSPYESRRSPPPGAASVGSMPSLTRFGGDGPGVGSFGLTDPSARVPRGDGRTGSGRIGSVVVGLVPLGIVIGCGLWAANTASSLLTGLLLFLLGGSIGALAGGMLSVALGHLSIARPPRRSAVDRRARLLVRPSDERAWRLCEIGFALAASAGWADRTVDPARRVPAILFSAVRRSLVVDRQYEDAQCALAHESLADLARDTLAGVAEERAALDAVEENLRAVLATATGIDLRRERIAQERRAAQEERALRARLTGRSAAVSDPIESHLQADSSAGLAAEAAAVSQLLAESDALLHDLD